MGMADLVPGISGGTVAFIMGFYEQLIESLKTLTPANFKYLAVGKPGIFFNKVSGRFLLPLGIGIISAFILFASLIHFILGDPVFRVYLYAAFFGLITASFIFCAKQLEKWSVLHVCLLVVGALSAHLLTGTTLQNEDFGRYAAQIEPVNTQLDVKNYDPSTSRLMGLTPAVIGAMEAKGILSKDAIIYDMDGNDAGTAASFGYASNGFWLDGWLVFCGAIAICAMLLPGISGSYLLTILGVYAVVIGALVDFISGVLASRFDPDSCLILLSLLVGIVIGLMIFSRAISWLLKNYRSLTLSALVGFMIGSLRSVWPFWTYEYVLDPIKLVKGPQLALKQPFIPYLDSALFWQAVLFFLGGYLVVFAIERLASALFATNHPALIKNPVQK